MTDERIKLAERIKGLEVKQDLTYASLEKIDAKIDTFIASADSKYATKDEVKAVKEHFAQINKTQDAELGNIRRFINKYGPIIVIIASQAGFGYLLVKGGP